MASKEREKDALPPESWQRIRLKTHGDLNRVHSVLVQYLQNPEKALELKELHIYNIGDEHYKEFWIDDVPTTQFRELPNRNEVSRWFAEIDECKVKGPTQENTNEYEDLFRGAMSAIQSMTPREASKLVEVVLWKGRILATKRAGQDLRPLLTTTFDFHYLQAVTILLLRLAKNLEAVTLPMLFGTLYNVMKANNDGQESEPFLQHLKHVRFSPLSGNDVVDDERLFNVIEFAYTLDALKRLPSLESLRIAAMDMDDTLIAPGSSNIKNIDIEKCFLGSLEASFLIRMSKRLEELRISLGGRATNKGYSMGLWGLTTIGKSLWTHRSTLKLLHLDADCATKDPRWGNISPLDEGMEDGVGPREQDTRDYLKEHMDSREVHNSESKSPIEPWKLEDPRAHNDTIGSLREFTALTHLSIGVNMLLGSFKPAPFRLVDALPPTLESLRIINYERGEWPEHDSHIEELLRQRSQKLPHLHHMDGIDEKIEMSRVVDDWTDEEENLVEYDNDMKPHPLPGYPFWIEPDVDDDWLEVDPVES